MLETILKLVVKCTGLDLYNNPSSSKKQHLVTVRYNLLSLSFNQLPYRPRIYNTNIMMFLLLWTSITHIRNPTPHPCTRGLVPHVHLRAYYTDHRTTHPNHPIVEFAL